jgi:aminoglycoside N3'-acetyltransferase
VHSRQDLAADLRALGVAAGDVVMVHASVKAIGEIAGGPGHASSTSPTLPRSASRASRCR